MESGMRRESESTGCATSCVCGKGSDSLVQADHLQPVKCRQCEQVHVQILFQLPRLGGCAEYHGPVLMDPTADLLHFAASQSNLEQTEADATFSKLAKCMLPPRYIFSFALKVLKNVTLFSLAFSLLVTALPFLGTALAVSFSVLLLGAMVAGSLILVTCMIQSLCWLQSRVKRAVEYAAASIPHVDGNAGEACEEWRLVGEALAVVAGWIDVWGTEMMVSAVACAAGWIDATFFNMTFCPDSNEVAEERSRKRLDLIKAFPRIRFSELHQSLSVLQASQGSAKHPWRTPKMAMAARQYALGNSACPICLEEFVEDDKVCQLLPTCVHFFHSRCIEPWFAAGNSLCPVCRSRLFPDEPLDTSDVHMEYEPYSAEEY